MATTGFSDNTEPPVSSSTASPADSATPDQNQSATDMQPSVAVQEERVSLPARIIGFALLALGALSLASSVYLAIHSLLFGLGDFRLATMVMNIVEASFDMVTSILYVAFSWKLLHNCRHVSAVIARFLMFILIASLLLDLMLSGASITSLSLLAQIALLVVFQTYLDPSLAQERELKHKLRKLDERAEEEARLERLRTLGEKVPYQLNFFNLFWTFVVASIVGLLLEEGYHLVLYHEIQDRAGLLFGPFSPIYGFGAVLMTLALNKIRDRNFMVIFLLSGLIGAGFEYFTSLFMELAFGITSWDYTGSFMSIGGRTNFAFMVCWGFLGVIWIKLLLPYVFRLVYLIPWNWRYAVTGIATALMLANGVMTLQSLNFWYERQAGQVPETPIEVFYAQHFSDDWMSNRFQTMSMDVDKSTRRPELLDMAQGADSQQESADTAISDPADTTASAA